jgi:hypothetical protein
MFGYKKAGFGSGYGFNEDRFGSGSGSVHLAGFATLVLLLLIHRFLLTNTVITSRGKAYMHTHTVFKLLLYAVLRIRIRDPESIGFLIPGSGIQNNFFPDPEPNPYF